MLKSIIQSVVQDVVTAGAAALAAHGYIANSDQQGLIGSVVFLVMLGVNAYLQHSQTAPVAQAKGN